MVRGIGAHRFDGAVAIVTGGASGIGRGLSMALASRGCHVILGDVNADALGRVAQEICAQGGSARATVFDVADYSAVNRVIDETVGHYGRLDYIFNNAGLSMDGEARGQSIDDWRRIINVNLYGVVHGTQAAYQVMVQQGFGHIVNTASIAGLLSPPWATSYVATKHAIVGLSRSLRLEAALHNVRVSAVCPVLVRTPMLESGTYDAMLEQQPEWLLKLVGPMSPADFAAGVLSGVARNQELIVVPGWWRLIHKVDIALPVLSRWIGRRVVIKLQQMTESSG